MGEVTTLTTGIQKKPVEVSSITNMEEVSLALQMLASVSWVVGAALAGPASVADYFQLFAAVSWCVSNVCAGAILHEVKQPKNGEKDSTLSNVVDSA